MLRDRLLAGSLVPFITVFASACSDDTGADTNTQSSGIPETSSSNGDGDGDGDTASGDGDGDTASGDGDGDTATSDDDPGDGDGDPAGPKFDTETIPDSNEGCGGGGGNIEFSYIWIANSSQGTLSKVDTSSLEEVGRYRVRPDSAGLPSRTSVNLSGDVAVANRSGGITKVYAQHADCVESNGTPGLQTSTGANDLLAWGEDECIAWHTPMAYTSQRPIAWTQGTYSQGSCTWSDQKVWTTGTNVGGNADVMLLNGDDGSVEQMINIPGLTNFNSFGGYGAVVDADGNLWFNEMWIFGDYLVKVNIEDLSYELIATNGKSGYGLAIDEEGRLWTCGGNSIARYDPETNQWDSTPSGLSTGGGCMVDAEGRLWASGDNSQPYSIIAYDVETLQQLVSHPMTEHLHGISIDFAGYVWGVGGTPGSGQGERAFRIDPDSGDYETVEGLTGAYTYSDMTGFSLASQGGPAN